MKTSKKIGKPLILSLAVILYSALAFASSTRFQEADALRSVDHTKTWSLPASTDTLVGETSIPTSGLTGQVSVTHGGTGSSSLTINNVLLGNNTSALQVVAPGTSGNVLTSNGTTWSSETPTGGGSIPNRTFNSQSTSAYTLALTDTINAGTNKIVLFGSTAETLVTIPLNSSVAFPTGSQIDVIQTGGGSVIFSPQSGVTMNSFSGYTSISGQYGQVSLVKRDTDTWNLAGDISSSIITATGGTVTQDGNFKIHTFTTSGTFQITSGFSSVEYLIIAGGGGGGASHGGGGGAGGYRTSTLSRGSGSYTVTIGAGGAAGPSQGTAGSPGSDSVFDTITSLGGGGGHSSGAGNSNVSAADGGSGGGSSSKGTAGSAGTAGQGSAGGRGFTDNASFDNAGGGGGAGAIGGDGTNGSGHGGNGGNGTASSISGSSVTYAGGGGGKGDGTGGTAGTGGGGTGGNGTAGPTAGGANTGGGGGGGNGGAAGAAGGSGIVIVRYQFQ